MEIQDPLYYERMDSSIGDKKKIIPHIVGTKILDVGCGDGVLMEALQSNGYEAYGLDATAESIERTKLRGFSEDHLALGFAHEASNFFADNFFDTIICSSIIHEVYSYGSPEYGILSPETVDDTFKNLLKVLKPGGRLIIRDGIIPEDWDDKQTIIFNPNTTVADIHLVEKYLNMIPFKTEETTPVYRKVNLTKLGDFVYEGSAESVMEFLYTYTWGEKAFPRETKELYGFHTLTNYVNFLSNFNVKIISTESYLQPGYAEHLKNKALIFKNWEYQPFPDSNAIIVIEKN